MIWLAFIRISLPLKSELTNELVQKQHRCVLKPKVMMKSGIFILFLLKTQFLPFIYGASHPENTVASEFCYNADIAANAICLGPNDWPGECGSGHCQSPIDIRKRDVSNAPWDDESTFWLSSGYIQSYSEFWAINNGHTFQIQLNGNKMNPSSEATLSGAGFQDVYTFAQLHFHWGESDDMGSEHTIQGRRYPMELHMVHYKSRYDNLSHALQVDDVESVAVLAVLFKLGNDNQAMAPIVQAASSPNAIIPEQTLLHYSNTKINLKNLLPNNLNFVRYLGSLTTPPCSEKVAWSVFMQPVTISSYQLEVFRRLRDDEETPFYNFRPTRPRNGRKLKYYRVWGWSWGVSPFVVFKTFVKEGYSEITSYFYNFYNRLSKSL